MRVKVWEIGVATLAIVMGVIFVLGGAMLIGVSWLMLTGVWGVARVGIVPNLDQAGRFASLRGRLAAARVVLLFGVYGTLIAALFAIRSDGLQKTRTGVIATLAIGGCAFLLLREMNKAEGSAVDWLVGSRSESEVGARLQELPPQFLVLHGVPKDRGGDIDHVVCGPGGAFAIETKSYRFSRKDIGQAAGNAAWLKERLGILWAVGVLCVAEEPRARKSGVIWVMSAQHLVPWLEAQRGRSVEPDYARRLLT